MFWLHSSLFDLVEAAETWGRIAGYLQVGKVALATGNLARLSLYTMNLQAMLPGLLQKHSCSHAPCQHPHRACWVTTYEI